MIQPICEALVKVDGKRCRARTRGRSNIYLVLLDYHDRDTVDPYGLAELLRAEGLRVEGGH